MRKETMMPAWNFKDLTDQTFGKLTVVERAPNIGKASRWKCRCECGNKTVIYGNSLRAGKSRSCGHCGRYECRYVSEGIGVMKCILKTGESFLFDEDDFGFVSSRSWCINENGYIVSSTSKGNCIRLHRCLTDVPEDKEVDHINGDRTDNRRSNLRICTHSENNGNRGMSSKNTSGFKGVSYKKERGKYVAQIMVDYKHHYLGIYDDPIEAARAYDEAARFYFGEFAKTNFGKGGIYGEILELDKTEGREPGDRRRDCRAGA